MLMRIARSFSNRILTIIIRWVTPRHGFGYFVMRDEVIVGVGGFVEKPKDGRVEIAYSTFKANEGQGIASFTCKQLIEIAKTTDPSIVVTAKTAPEQNASVKILQRNGFVFTGIVQDHEIGDVWEWVLQEANLH